MVQTRSGKRTRRVEDQRDMLEEFNRNVRQRMATDSAPDENDSEEFEEDNSFNFLDNIPSIEESANLAQDLDRLSANQSGNFYRRSDACKRHRVKDSSPYTEEVSSYKRRKPIR